MQDQLTLNLSTADGKTQCSSKLQESINSELDGRRMTMRKNCLPKILTSAFPWISYDNIQDLSIIAILFIMRTMKWWGRSCSKCPPISSPTNALIKQLHAISMPPPTNTIWIGKINTSALMTDAKHGLVNSHLYYDSHIFIIYHYSSLLNIYNLKIIISSSSYFNATKHNQWIKTSFSLYPSFACIKI